MTEPEMPDVALHLTVVVYADGGTQVTVAPTADGRVPSTLLREAAVTLSHMADNAALDEETVTCPLCGEPAASFHATPDGHTVIGPCGHVLP